MKHLFFKLLFLYAVLIIASGIQAQITIREALNYISKIDLPHNAGKGITYKNSVGIQNPNGQIPNRLYKNFQLTDYFLADDQDTAPAIIAKFNLPDPDYTLAIVNWGGMTDYMTDVLILVDHNGDILSILEASVWYFPGIPAKQYRILKDGTVIVTALKPTTTASVFFEDFTSFTANRIDQTYKVVDGKFELSDTKTYPVATYTRRQLSDKTYNLWD